LNLHTVKIEFSLSMLASELGFSVSAALSGWVPAVLALELR
jgi:hypothetical protein